MCAKKKRNDCFHQYNKSSLGYIVLFFCSQMMEASLYDKIMDQQRLEPEFFRVGFYGKKFPFFLRVKTSLYSLFVKGNLNRLILQSKKNRRMSCLLHKTHSSSVR